MRSIFEKIKKSDLVEYIDLVSKIVNIDKDKAYQLAINSTRYYKGDKSLRDSIRHLNDLENKWYKSLKDNKPDYSIYEDKYLLFDLWPCWTIYSRKYLLSIKKELLSSIGNIYSVADLGCGFGYTSTGLKELFPEANIWSTNFYPSTQWDVASFIGQDESFYMLTNEDLLKKKIDLVFASEYFEHIESPIEHLEEIIDKCEPKFLLIANSFNTISIGHFKKYKYIGQPIDMSNISRLFNLALRSKGYEKVTTKIWNQKPAFWRKK